MNLREIPDSMREPIRLERYFKEAIEERYRDQAEYLLKLASDNITKANAQVAHRKQLDIDKIKRLDNVQRYDFVVPQRVSITETVNIADSLPT